MKNLILIAFTLVLTGITSSSCNNEPAEKDAPATETQEDNKAGKTNAAPAIRAVEVEKKETAPVTETSTGNENLPGKGTYRQQIEQIQNTIAKRTEVLQSERGKIDEAELNARFDQLKNIRIELNAVLKNVNELDASDWQNYQQSANETLAKIRKLLAE